MVVRTLVLPTVLALSLLTVGCATKKFVREEIEKGQAQTEAKTGEQVGRLESELGREKTRLGVVAAETTEVRAAAADAARRADVATTKASEATAAAGQAGSRADEAGQKAGQAAAKADEATGAAGQALAKAEQTDTRLTRLWKERNKRTLGETVAVVFGFDKWQLDDRAQTSLLDVVKQLQDNPSIQVDLQGYTDSVGPSPYNIQLSQRRADAVRRFLVEKGIELHRINWIGLGDFGPVADNRTKPGRDQNRRVTVQLFVPAAD
jgi:OOP family OmpA-OmpF porin